MKLIKLVIFLTITLISQMGVSAPATRGALTINKIHPMAVNRIHCEKCSGVTRIYVNSGAWEATDCRNDAGDLYKEDNHILSVLMMAWTTGKKIKIEVNDEDRPVDKVCKITAVYIYD